jgi:hypothetical protein
VEAGFPGLSRTAKATVHRILAAQRLYPEKIKYYVERRDPDFEAKIRKVLIVYQEVELQNANRAAGESASSIIIVSVDQKPGVQAIANTAPHLPPVADKHSNISRGANMRGRALVRSWQPWISRTATSRHAWRTATAASNSSVYCRTWTRGIPGMHHPNHTGQPFPRTFQGDANVSLHAPQPFSAHPDAKAWFMAQSRRDSGWQNGTTLSPAHRVQSIGELKARIL